FAARFLVVEIRTQAHHRPDLRMASQAFMHVGLILVEPVFPARIGFECVLVRPDEDVVMRRRFGGARERQRALDHVREANRPFIGLLCPPRPPEDQFETLNLEVFCHEPMLGTNVVADGDIWKRAAVERRWRIAGRRREALANWPGRMMKYFFGSSGRSCPMKISIAFG